jgi:hypothetical protein
MNKNINKEMLKDFAFDHFTYINQIFGDLTVREIITELYNKKNNWEMIAENASSEFDGSFHHVLRKKNKKGKYVKWCSVEKGYQNMEINENDTLCQSYTLLKYRDISIDKKDSKSNQMKMIKLYRQIIKKKHFQKEIKQLIEDEDNKNLYSIYYENDQTVPMPMNFSFIMNNIIKTLNNWEKYGFRYFIGK